MFFFGWGWLQTHQNQKKGKKHHAHRAVVEVSGLFGGNITGLHGGNIKMCAAIINNGVLHPHANLGPNNPELIIWFLDRFHELIQGERVDDNWFVVNRLFTVLYFPL